MECLICNKENPKGRRLTCSKKCARTYGYSMDSKARKELRIKRGFSVTSNPFRNYKQALKHLFRNIQKKMLLSNYKPTDTDWAFFTILNSETFKKRLENKNK